MMKKAHSFSFCFPLSFLLLLACVLGSSQGFAQVYTPGQEPKPAAPQETKFPDAEKFSKSNMTGKIITAANNTFGYGIFADGKLMIHQPSVPGMPGNTGFKTKGDAEKVAQLVIQKIKRGEMPPTVTAEEMKKLKVNW